MTHSERHLYFATALLASAHLAPSQPISPSVHPMSSHPSRKARHPDFEGAEKRSQLCAPVYGHGANEHAAVRPSIVERAQALYGLLRHEVGLHVTGVISIGCAPPAVQLAKLSGCLMWYLNL
eukprot:637825-Pleurochrysis_carterae.AAC.2